MAMRSKISKRKSKVIFRKTSGRTNVMNIPRKIVQRGGTRL